MPGPDPDGLNIDEGEDGINLVMAFRTDANVLRNGGNMRHRYDRARHIEIRLRRGWNCLQCRELVPIYQRADACYCSEGCRKRAARQRRVRLRWLHGDGKCTGPDRISVITERCRA